MGAKAGGVKLSSQQLGRGQVVFDHKHQRPRQIYGLTRGPGRDPGRNRSCRSPDRQAKCERAALAEHALDQNITPMQECEPARERKTQPGALLAPAGSGVHLEELVEDLALILRRDPDSRVHHRDLDGRRLALSGHRHRPILRRELDRVRDQVQQHLLQLSGVGDHVSRARDLGADVDPLLLRQRLHEVQDLRHDCLDLDRLQAQLHLSCLDLGQVEDVVDQAEEMLAARMDL